MLDVPYSYSPVTRVITIEFRPLLPGGEGEQEILVTPNHAEVRSRDTIVWDIQGAPAGAAVTIRNFHFKGATKVVSFGPGGTWKVDEVPFLGQPQSQPHTPEPFPAANFPKTFPKTLLSANTEGCAIGVYRYEIFFDGVCVIDPDVEIKPPRGR
jgi:hypothetical protein